MDVHVFQSYQNRSKLLLMFLLSYKQLQLHFPLEIKDKQRCTENWTFFENDQSMYHRIKVRNNI